MNAEQGPNGPEDQLVSNRINRIVTSGHYKEFGTPEAASLQQAIDILVELRSRAAGKRRLAFDKLDHAIVYLDRLLSEHIENGDSKE